MTICETIVENRVACRWKNKYIFCSKHHRLLIDKKNFFMTAFAYATNQTNKFEKKKKVGILL
jgi:hypothetical protein